MSQSLFDPACTAEQLVAAVDAAYSLMDNATVDRIAEFIDVVPNRAISICNLAVSMELLNYDSQSKIYSVNRIARLLVTASLDQKSAILRLFIEDFKVFQVFRQRMLLDGSTDSAIRHVKTVLNLPEHPAEIAQTLTSLGTYCGVLHKEQGAIDYIVSSEIPETYQSLLMSALSDRANAERFVLTRVGNTDGQPPEFRDDVLTPLIDGAIHAARNESDQAIFRAGNAIDSFLKIWSQQLFPGNPVTGPGIGANVKQIADRNGKLMSKKLSAMGYYLGHLRNAADHGQDPEIGQVWSFSHELGESYILVSCNFIRSSLAISEKNQYIL